MGWSQRLGADHYTEVQDEVRQAADAAGLDAVLLDDPEDVAYLTGFFHHPTERPVAGKVGVRGRLGYATSTSVGRLASVSSAFGPTQLVATELVARARLRKRPAELAAHVTSFGSRMMYAEHDDVVVVSPLAGGLVYAGPNSARPHALPSAYRLRPGDTFMLSLGCAVGGRFVEGERTFLLGEPTDEQRRYYEVVREAQQTGTEAILAGARCADVNRACLDVVRAAGLERYLRHRQGHGIGLGMHEPPWLEDGDDTVLEPGMIVSSEPGLYIPGHAGYRISDSVLVTEEGPRPFTSYPRSLEDAVVPL
jgi:Xaa-Pro aminopeptidase